MLAVGLAAGTISGIVGFGSSIMLMPVLVVAYGPLHAVPIMAIAAILANLSRVIIWWREVDWRAVAAYSVTGVPAAALGARTLLALPPRLIEGALGVVLPRHDPGAALARRARRLGCGRGTCSCRCGDGLPHRHRGDHRADHRADLPRRTVS